MAQVAHKEEAELGVGLIVDKNVDIAGRRLSPRQRPEQEGAPHSQGAELIAMCGERVQSTFAIDGRDGLPFTALSHTPCGRSAARWCSSIEV